MIFFLWKLYSIWLTMVSNRIFIMKLCYTGFKSFTFSQSLWALLQPVFILILCHISFFKTLYSDQYLKKNDKRFLQSWKSSGIPYHILGIPTYVPFNDLEHCLKPNYSIQLIKINSVLEILGSYPVISCGISTLVNFQSVSPFYMDKTAVTLFL